MFETNFKERNSNKERAILVGLCSKGASRWQIDDYLNELELLTDTAGAVVLDKIVQVRDKIDPSYFIGRGKVEELHQRADELAADLIIFDDDLSPAQVKNIAKICKQKIIDRSGLILDIFAHRAQTREARTQVELAQLKYLLPRLTRAWQHLSRQVGGQGIGLRGPGETQLEMDRRLVHKRINRLELALERIKRQRATRRSHRDQFYKVALVGYTNAGKSTLLNALTNGSVFVENRLFATLDSTVRAMANGTGVTVLAIDTVGFIRKLPHDLVASFKSTLEEILDADLLLHVVDISQPNFDEHIEIVNKVLDELGAGEKPELLIFNKIDLVKEASLIVSIKNRYNSCLMISASRGIFIESVKEEILKFFQHHLIELKLKIVLEHGKSLAKLYSMAKVLKIKYNNGYARVTIRARRIDAERIQRLPGVKVESVN